MEDGKRHGQGKMVYANGDSYYGNWSDDMRDTMGGKNAVFELNDGTCYEGAWKNDQRSGVHTRMKDDLVVQVYENDG